MPLSKATLSGWGGGGPQPGAQGTMIVKAGPACRRKRARGETAPTKQAALPGAPRSVWWSCPLCAGLLLSQPRPRRPVVCFPVACFYSLSFPTPQGATSESDVLPGSLVSAAQAQTPVHVGLPPRLPTQTVLLRNGATSASSQQHLRLLGSKVLSF